MDANDDKPPLVSVHITTYNRSSELERCVRSVWAQTYPNIEIVIADDCSPDNTQEVVRKLQAESPFPVRYVRHDSNRGNASARNSCLAASGGFYVAFLDDDDEWIDPQKTEKQVAVLAGGAGERVGFVATRVRIQEPHGSRESAVALPDRLVAHILRRNGLFYSPSVLTTRRLLDEVGWFDARLPRGVDSDFYRFCIVKLKCVPVLLADVTTLVHAEGEGRMTDYASAGSLRKEIVSHRRTLRKYAAAFAARPGAVVYRLRKIAVARLRLVRASAQ